MTSVNTQIGRILQSLSTDQYRDLFILEKDKQAYFTIDEIKTLCNVTKKSQFRTDYNTFASENGLAPHLPAFKPKKGKGLPKLAFAPVQDILSFLRARKSDAAQALVAKIDQAIANLQRAGHREELGQSEKALFEEEAARKRAESRTEHAEEDAREARAQTKVAEDSREASEAYAKEAEAKVSKLQKKLDAETQQNIGILGKSPAEICDKAMALTSSSAAAAAPASAELPATAAHSS